MPSRPLLKRDSILSGDSYLAPAGPLESVLAGIWASALALDRVGRNDDFFELGGDSVAAVEICTAISRDLNLELRTHMLIRAPTLASFGCVLAAARAHGAGAELGSTAPTKPSGAAPVAEPIEILIASVALPEQGKPRAGAVVLGSGNGHVPTVRALAGQGIAAVQVRLIRDNEHHLDLQRRYATYDESGVMRCQRAMAHLAATAGIDEFILFGNCALANICFNTALADPRVSGLILLNPRVSGARAGFFFRLRAHLLRARSWGRLLRGDMQLWHGVRANESASAAAAEPVLGSSYTKDMALPSDFDEQLLRLTSSRALRVLLVFSRAEPSLAHLQRFFRSTLKSPIASGKVRIAVLDSDSHDPFATHDESASVLKELIVDWTSSMRSPAPVMRDERGGMQTLQPAHQDDWR